MAQRRIDAVVTDPLGAEQPSHAGAGRVPGLDFERMRFIHTRAMRIWGGFGGDAFWIAACRQARSEWELLAFLRRLGS
jgi:hypothetical protein